MAVFTRVSGGSTVREYVRDIAVAANQVFVEVPARNILRPCLRRPFVERMRVRAFDHGLRRNREGDAVLVLRGLGDLASAARFLPAEIVGGNADDRQAATVKFGPQFLQAGILRRESAKRGGIDDQQRVAGKLGQPDIAAGQSRKRKRVSGDPAHAGLCRSVPGRQRAGEGAQRRRHHGPAVHHGRLPTIQGRLGIAQQAISCCSTSRYGEIDRLAKRNDEIRAFAGFALVDALIGHHD